jgi:uncharacterized protein (DUF885 family)
MRRLALLFAAILMTAILGAPTAAAADPTADLHRLIDEYWQGTLEANPRMATSIGDRRYDGRLEDNSRGGIQREEKRLREVLERAREIDATALSAEDRGHHAALVEIVESDLLESECDLEEWVVDPMRGPQVWVFNLPANMTIKTPENGARYIERLEAFETWMERHTDNLERGLARGRVSNRDAIRKSIEALDAVLGQADEDWEVMAPAREPHEAWPDHDRERFARDLANVIRRHVRPALASYRAFLDERLRPVARPQEKAGLAALDGGVECYRKLIRVQTSLNLSPEEAHRLGLEHVAKFRADLAELGVRVLGTGEIGEIQKQLRGDSKMHFASAEEVEEKARESLARARAAIPA